jgi:hypothetical protein
MFNWKKIKTLKCIYGAFFNLYGLNSHQLAVDRLVKQAAPKEMVPVITSQFARRMGNFRSSYLLLFWIKYRQIAAISPLGKADTGKISVILTRGYWGLWYFKAAPFVECPKPHFEEWFLK